MLPVLDDFNRADGAVGAKWLGYPNRYVVASNMLMQAPSGLNADSNTMMYFDQVLGTTQEVGIQIGALITAEETSEIGLMLKWQGPGVPGALTSPKCYAIEVQYSPNDNRARISYCDEESSSWESSGSVPLTLAAGDFFSARADAAGKVQVFKNGVLVGYVTVTDWIYFASPGRPGLWIDDVPASTLDNFSAE